MTADVESSHLLFPLLSMAHSSPLAADHGASAFATSSLHGSTTAPSQALREVEKPDRLQPVDSFDLALSSRNSFTASQGAQTSIVASAISAAAAAANKSDHCSLQPTPCLQSPADVTPPIAIPRVLRGTGVVAVTGAGIEANALSPHSTLSGGVTQKLFLSTQSFRSFPPNLPLSALGSCSASGSSGSASPCGEPAELGAKSFSAKRHQGGSESRLKKFNLSMSMPNLNGWLRSKERRHGENTGGSAHGPDEKRDLSAVFEAPQNAAQDAAEIADAIHTGLVLSRSHKEPVREVSWGAPLGMTEEEEIAAAGSLCESSRGRWRISRSSRSHREQSSRTGWATIRLPSLSSSRLLPGKNFLRNHGPNGSSVANDMKATGAMGPAGGEALINLSLAQSCECGSAAGKSAETAEAEGPEGARAGEGAECGEVELLGLEAEEGIVVSWSLSTAGDVAGRGDGGAVCASAEEAGGAEGSARGGEWAEEVAGEDRMQVVASGDGYVFSAVFDGFTDTSAADFLLANLHACFAQQLTSRGLHFGEAGQSLQEPNSESSADSKPGADASSQQRRHDAVLEALAAALAEAEAAYSESVGERMGERLELAVAGACVVVAVVAGSELYVMNLGDCRAVLVEEGEEGEGGDAEGGEEGGEGQKRSVKELRAVQLTVDHNTGNEQEVERIRRERSDDPDAITKMRVKGKLKATRAFGAAYLKNPEVNAQLLGMLRVQYVGSQPYLSSTPHLRHVTLAPTHRYLLLSSDGLYQYMTPDDAAAAVSRSLTDAAATGAAGDASRVDAAAAEAGCREPCDGGGACGVNLSHVLVQEALGRAARRAGMTVEQLLKIRAGDYRRQLHDDLSVTVLELHC